MSQDGNLSYNDLLRIVELIKTSEQFSEFRLKIGDIEIELKRRDAAAPDRPAPPPHAVPPTRPAGVERVSPTAAPAPSSPPGTTWPEGSVVIRAPMVGTFYRSPEPGAAPFVAIGDAVEPDTVVCIIEVMKLMNSIAAGARGTVKQILVDDAQAVDAHQALIVVEPAR